MVLWLCSACTAGYAVGLAGCPQCGSTDYSEEGQDMPKITVHGGPTNAADPISMPPADEETALAAVEPAPDPDPAPGPAEAAGSKDAADPEAGEHGEKPARRRARGASAGD